MSEGARFPWKIQKLNLAPSLSYDCMHKPLQAPKGKSWSFDPVNKEWSLVTSENQNPVTVDAVAYNDDPLATVVEHHITPSDTFQGICLRYKVTPLELRRANGGFTGENLNLVPNPLKIPCNVPVAEEVNAKAKALNKSQVEAALLKECRSMSRTEARAYLMLSDYDLAEAFQNAHDDGF